MTEWHADLLGEGFEARELDLGEDDEGPLVATLVRSLPSPLSVWERWFRRTRELEDTDVLYVHGWSDYFFQSSLARFFTDRGARFFALDLRKYGRSIRDGQTPGYIENLSDYDEEIGQALEVMGHRTRVSEDTNLVPSPGDERAGSSHTHRRLVLFGHSTGGLILSLWSARYPGVADGLLLNSPWLELQLSGPVRRALHPMVALRAKFNPHELALPQLDLGFYSQAQRLAADPGDPLTVDLRFRPELAHPIRAGWLKAILAGHATISEGIDVGAPVCVLLSARSCFSLAWRDEMQHSDTVLEVEEVARASVKLGASVRVERIDGALHDVFISAPQARADAYRRLESWVRCWSSVRR